MGSGAGGGGSSSLPGCDSLACTLIGSSTNLLSWMLCAGIGSKASPDAPPDRKKDGEVGCPSHHFEGRLREEGWEKKKGSIPSPLPFCVTAALPPPPSPSLPPSLSLWFSFSLFPLTHLFLWLGWEEGHLPLPDDSAFQLLEDPQARQHVPPATAVPGRPVLCTTATAAAAGPSHRHRLFCPSAQVRERYYSILPLEESKSLAIFFCLCLQQFWWFDFTHGYETAWVRNSFLLCAEGFLYTSQTVDKAQLTLKGIFYLPLKSQLGICSLMMENLLVETGGRQSLCDALSS